MPVPFMDLAALHNSIRPELDAAIKDVIDTSAFIGGPYVAAFNRQFADYCGTRHAVGVSNGTHAISLALRALGIAPGDEVITVPQTFIATAEAITAVGATVRFVDVEPKTATMDPHALEAAISPRTRAVVPVHLYGHPADMRAINDIAKANDLRVVGDAAQAHGATLDGLPVAKLADATCFSFYPGKNLGAFGDAGAVVTDDDDVARQVAMRSDHGRVTKYEHDFEGENCRLDGLQAAILSVKLRHLEQWTKSRRELAAAYNELLAGVPDLQVPFERPGTCAVYHLYVIRTPKRDALRKHLSSVGISTGIHYPVALHRQRAYARMNLGEGAFPVSEAISREGLSLPLYPGLTMGQVEQVADEVRIALRG